MWDDFCIRGDGLCSRKDLRGTDADPATCQAAQQIRSDFAWSRAGVQSRTLDGRRGELGSFHIRLEFSNHFFTALLPS